MTPKQERFVQEYLVDCKASCSLKACEAPVQSYVYALVDPVSDEIFYVGKGKNRRFATHEAVWRSGRVDNARKFNRISRINRAGHSVKRVLVEDGLSPSEALALERELIEALGFERLTNIRSGNRCGQEKAREEARERLSLIKPFQQWLGERQRSSQDRQFYHFVAAGFAKIAHGR